MSPDERHRSPPASPLGSLPAGQRREGGSTDLPGDAPALPFLGEPGERFSTLFHHAPISLWEVDWSGVKAQVDQLRAAGVEDLKGYYEANPEAVKQAVRTLRVVDFNEATLRLYGAPDRETFLRHLPGLLDTTYWDSFPDLVARFAAGETRHAFEGRERMLDGEERILRFTRSLPESDLESWARVIEVFEDVTEERRAREALERSEAALRRSQRIARIATWEWDEIEERDLYCSPEVYSIYGVEPGKDIQSLADLVGLIHPEDRERFLELYRDTHDNPRPYSIEMRIVRPDGETRWVQERAEPILDESGLLTGYRGTIQDITERREVEEELRRKEAALLESQRIASLSTWEWDEINQRDVYASVENFRIYGIEPRDTPLTFDDVYQLTHPDDRASYKAHYEDTHRNPRPYATEFRIIRPDGAVRYVQRRAEPIFDASGRLTGYRGTVQDVTERRLAEEELRRSDDALRASQRIASIGTWEWDEKRACTIYASDELFRVYGLVPTDEPLTSERLDAIIHPDDLPAHRALVEETSQNPRPYNQEFRVRNADGRVRRLRVMAEPIYDGRGAFTGYRGTTQDITEQWAREEQLRQAYKMKALGQLTGGIAHDFNNLLGIIIGNLELAQEGVRDGADVERFLALALRSAERGADLIQRLLAFSRSQSLKPAVVDSGALLKGMEDLLRRTLGEAVTVEIDCPGNAWACHVDAVQLESALLNLAINARDAMPDGGRIRITAENRSLDGAAARPLELEPGAYLCLTVSDEGTGMPQDVVEQAVEPFFTTKEVGKGSGLGLSMVYGLARQSGGALAISSETGKGTSVTILLPRHRGTDEAAVPEERPEDQVEGRTAGQVLLVEDDHDLRSLLQGFLESAGYDVLQAASGPEALKVLEGEPALDLLLTDLVLPDGMSGGELAEKVRQRYPDLPLLFASGYPRHALEGHPALDAVELLQKPFRKSDLIDAVQRVREKGRLRA